jgi:hypothetical protein
MKYSRLKVIAFWGAKSFREKPVELPAWYGTFFQKRVLSTFLSGKGYTRECIH